MALVLITTAFPATLGLLWVMLTLTELLDDNYKPSPTVSCKPPYVPKRLRRQCFWNTPFFIKIRTWLHSIAQRTEHSIYSLKTSRVTYKRHSKRTTRRSFSYRLRVRARGQRAPYSRRLTARFSTRCYDAHTSSLPRHLTLDSDSFTLAVDNCASCCMTNSIKDFHSYHRIPRKREITGLGQCSSDIIGTVRWTIENDDDKPHTFEIRDCLYVPELQVRLLSPQHWSQQLKEQGIYAHADTDADRTLLEWGDNRRTINLDPASNVSFIRTASSYDKANRVLKALNAITIHDPYCMPAHIIPDDDNSDDPDQPATEPVPEGDATDPVTTVSEGDTNEHEIPPFSTPLDFDFQDPHLIEADTDEENIEWDEPATSLLQWHYRLGHIPFDKIKRMSQAGELPAHLQRCRTPKCAACLYGKAAKRPWRTKSPPNRRAPPAVNGPGDCVSIDQLESSTSGLIAQLRGFITKQRYTCATVFVDQYSRLSFVYCQKTTKGDETLEAKRAFEAYAKSHGVTVKHYHADNGRFAEALFINHCKQAQQTISFSGVNAHWQNGMAEKRIRDLQDQARTMLVHSQHRWKAAITAHLWPYAIRMANDVHMYTPLKSGRTPIELFSQVAKAPQLRHFHTFGCPVYVLHEKMQESKKGPKWQERARVGIYLGNSPVHSRSVALVLNIDTGLCSPQFHVSFDDFFETVKGSTRQIRWQEKCYFVESKDGSTEPDKPPRPDTIVLPPSIAEPEPTPEQAQTNEQSTASEGARSDETPATHHQAPPTEAVPATPITTTETTNNNDLPAPAATATPTRRSMRTIRPPERLIAQTAFIAQPWDDVWDIQDYEIQESLTDPVAFAASSNPDIMYMHEALKAPDRDQFIEAMKREVEDHEKRNHWEVVSKDDIPQGTKILPAVWAMRRKRRIATGEIYKWKARLNVHGGKQIKGVHFWETYSPVVTWFSIRLFLTLAIIHGWHTRQVDFVLAYPQADIETELYMEIPKGFKYKHSCQTHALRLKKNIYGGKAAGRVWNQYLHKGLTKIGFKQSKIDACVYYRDQTVFLTYVDDTIILSPDPTEADRVVAQLRALKYDVTDEGEISDYLGVKVERQQDGTIKLTQPQLIDQILQDLNLIGQQPPKDTKAKAASTPALSSVILQRDKDGPPHAEGWNYRSVIGKLNFLEKSTRPELSYQVHQCARFSADPKASHAKAVKRIGRYLLATRDAGIILKPDPSKSFDVWVDSDFCGQWDPDTAIYDPTTARSRTGYIIMYAGCPILWASKLQTETALSTTESEYSASSEALRNALPLMELIQEAHEQGINVPSPQTKMHCKLFIDNAGAVELFRLPKMRPRTKHINTKMHHFREHLLYQQGKITAHHVPTESQLADIATKPLSEALFIKFWKLITGHTESANHALA